MVDVDYVVRVFEGKEVEEFIKKEIVKVFRSKVLVE